LGVLAAIAFIRAPSSSADPASDSTEAQFLALINDYREQNAVGPLVINVDLSEAADWFVNDMTSKNYFPDSNYCWQHFQQSAHCDSYGGRPPHRISAFGYGPATIGENAGAGLSSAQAIFDAWKGSSGHNATMLRSYWKSIGIAWACKPGTIYGCYWVTDFGSIIAPPNPNLPYPAVLGTPTPTATPTPAPTPSPTPSGLMWEDLNCDAAVLPQDAITLLMGSAGLENIDVSVSAPDNCPAPGENITVNGISRVWGDIDCSGAINALDSVNLLRWLIGLPLEPSDPTCPEPGDTF
jgi:uncharacterized protein YkwD